MIKLSKSPLWLLSFLQALATTTYIFLIGTLMQNLQKVMGNKPDTIFAPMLALTLFLTSALICGLLVLGYPIYLFFAQKKRQTATKLTIFTTAWFFLFVFILLILNIVF